MLKTPPVNTRTFSFSVLHCNCRLLSSHPYAHLLGIKHLCQKQTMVDLFPIFRGFSTIFQNISRTYLGSQRNIVPRINGGAFSIRPGEFVGDTQFIFNIKLLHGEINWLLVYQSFRVSASILEQHLNAGRPLFSVFFSLLRFSSFFAWDAKSCYR